ncbi:PLP-dependent aminotransferase family protein [Vibrio sp. JPW-9-11-11]|uniref:aminotransferase-like domain-containing protein n=1 Tax=Vibrio sp. JPW-9-11-11 TaxID=1416532 RepID=UPI001592B1DC|nr:PLP-dependent aminotransferase family protein [Vibrio sp. JPW-9-11-11]NVD08886.1 PLP-dependent aminotransferase family protein [Vibrio sp. JPW-9-11-11]
MSGNKYLMVEDDIRAKIEQGHLTSGDKLPSIRTLSADLAISKNTVIRAYQELEAQGLIYAIEKSGYRVCSVPTITAHVAPPNPVDLLSRCKEILTYSSQPEWLATGSAHPCIESNAIRSLYAEIGRHSRQQSHTPSHYQLPPGNQLLVEHVSKISRELGAPVSSSEIAITHGAQQAISLALRALTRPGDIVAVESPCYFGNLLLMESLGLQVVEIPSCPRTGMDPVQLKQAVAQWPIQAIVVTPNFTNPTGARMPLDKRIDLLKAAQTIAIIEDDVFGALSFEQVLPPLKALDTHDRVIYVNSLSKTLDSRLRIGWIAAGRYQGVIEKFLVSDNMGSLNLMQSAVADFLNQGKYKQHVKKMQRDYHTKVRQFCQQLSLALDDYSNLKGQYQIHCPQGSFLVWLTLPLNTDSERLYQQAKQHSISILPGTLFATQGQYRHCIRFSCSNVTSHPDWTSAVAKLAQLIHHQVNE